MFPPRREEGLGTVVKEMGGDMTCVENLENGLMCGVATREMNPTESGF